MNIEKFEKCFNDIKSKFDFEHVYDHYSMSYDEQLKIIDEAINTCEKAYMKGNDYCEVINENFVIGYRLTKNNMMNTYIYFVPVKSNNIINFE